MVTSKLRNPLGRVLVPVDLSPFSTHVLERVAHLPLASGATVSLLHVRSANAGRAAAEPGASSLRAIHALDDQVAWLTARVPKGVQVTSSTATGQPFEVISARARELGAELLVLGRHGHRGFADALIGSTAERVVRTSEVPVLVVNQASTQPYRRALVAVDLSKTSRRALETALRVLDAHRTELRVVHADDGRAWDVTSGMLDFLAPYESLGLIFEVTDRRGDPRPVILSEAASARPDLLVLGTHGHSTVVQHLLGSVADAVLRSASCDVLVARAG
jgi:nucleotide-binding universal stress UspA family protein